MAEELERRVAAHVEERVAAVLGSEAVRRELQQRLERERKAIEEQVRDARKGHLLPSSCPVSQLPSRAPKPRTYQTAAVLTTCTKTGCPRTALVPMYVVPSFQAVDGCCCPPFPQVERELQVERERAAREEEARREAIRAQQQELQQLEDERRKEVGCSAAWREQAAGNKSGCAGGRECANQNLGADSCGGWLGAVATQVEAVGMQTEVWLRSVNVRCLPTWVWGLLGGTPTWHHRTVA